MTSSDYCTVRRGFAAFALKITVGRDLRSHAVWWRRELLKQEVHVERSASKIPAKNTNVDLYIKL